MAVTLVQHVTAGSLLRGIFRCPSLVYSIKHSRFLYSSQFLGLDKYQEQRERTKHQLGGQRDRFLKRIDQYFRAEGNFMVFTEDLKNVLFLCEDKEEDIQLCLKMIRRFNQQNKELRFGTFVFGPVVIRLFYYLKKPDVILEVIQDKDLDGFFDQFSSYQIAMDLLFKEGRYQDILDVFSTMKTKQLYGTKYPRECVVLVLGACYKLNTPESYQFALQLIRDAREVGATVLRKGLTFAAALALKQNDCKIALEMLALTAQTNYITVRNLKLILLSELDRLEDVFLILRSVIDQDVPTAARTQEGISQTTIDHIEAALSRIGDKEKSHMFEQMKRALREGNHITARSLEELLCNPVQSRPAPKDRDVDRSSASGIGDFTARYPVRTYTHMAEGSASQRQRQGLRDFEE